MNLRWNKRLLVIVLISGLLGTFASAVSYVRINYDQWPQSQGWIIEYGWPFRWATIRWQASEPYHHRPFSLIAVGFLSDLVFWTLLAVVTIALSKQAARMRNSVVCIGAGICLFNVFILPTILLPRPEPFMDVRITNLTLRQTYNTSIPDHFDYGRRHCRTFVVSGIATNHGTAGGWVNITAYLTSISLGSISCYSRCHRTIYLSQGESTILFQEFRDSSCGNEKDFDEMVSAGWYGFRVDFCKVEAR